MSLIIFSNEDSRKRRAPSPKSNVFAYQPSPVFIHNKMGSEVEEDLREPMHSSYRLPHDTDFQCPRCGQRMEEPRLLPCLHPICLSCVYELMSKSKWRKKNLISTKGKTIQFLIIILMICYED